MRHHGIVEPKPAVTIRWRDEGVGLAIDGLTVKELHGGRGGIKAVLPGGGVVDHGGVGAMAVLNVAHEGVAEEPKGEAIGESHREVAVGSGPVVGALEELVVLGEGGGGPVGGVSGEQREEDQ